jgi:SWI/SNF-related matrix-associated actin-dependent regulator 1 of chromatin subfamily A
MASDQLPLHGQPDPERLELKPFQREGIDWFRKHPAGLLADEPGLGKSVQALKAAVEPVIIVAPAMVLESGTWDDEIAKWAPGIEATQVSYSSLAQLGPNGRVDRDHLGFPLNPPKAEYRRRWGTKIGDEAHYIKGRKTNWSKAFLDLNAMKTELATGTPLPNWAHEAFMILCALYPNEARPGHTLGSFWRWANEWFEVTQSRHNPRAKEIGGLQPGTTWEEFREANWGDRFLMRLRSEVLKDLPPLAWTGNKHDGDPHEMFRVKMTREQARAYNALRRDFIAWLDSGAQITAWTTPALLVKLYKCATGLEVLDPNSKGSGKLDALKTLLHDRPKPTFVAAYYRDSVEAAARVARALNKTVGVVHGGIPSSQRQHAIRGFQAGNVDVLVATIETVSEGITLHQGGADQFICLERDPRPTKNVQVHRRLHRMGVTVPIIGVDILTEGTVDERMLELLQWKTDEQMGALGVNDMRSLIG